MVDRYQSILDESVPKGKMKSSSILSHENNLNNYDSIIKVTNQIPSQMKKQIRQYNLATTAEEQNEIAHRFKSDQVRLKKNRQQLSRQFKMLEHEPYQPQFLFIKQQLLKIVKIQMSLDVEMKQKVAQKQKIRQDQAKKYSKGSTQLDNTLNDLKEKRDQILYLDESVKECLDLLNLIGILVFENGEKIDAALENVEKANENLDMALSKIQVAKMRTQRSTNRKCCIIILALIAIAVVLVIYFVAL